jgi:sterol 24-C-methyltransferase
MSISSLQTKQVEQLIEKGSKFVQENSVAVGVSAVATVITGVWIWRKADLRRDGREYNSQISGSMRLLNNTDHTLTGNQFSESINDYEGMFAGARKETGAITSEESIEVRRARYAAMIDHFYNLVTDFYEWGWCQSFHFGPRFHNETFFESIKRAEYYLALRLGLCANANPNKQMKALDVGCGVGGPMRNIATFTGAKIEGLTINEYQVRIGNKYNEANGLAGQCSLKRGDFQRLEDFFQRESFDAAYAIEATCHSPDRVRCFSGVANCLKKGGLFCVLEWVMLPGYDPKNKEHVRIKEGIEVGNGLPTLVTPDVCVKNFEEAGFEVVDHFDLNRGQHASNEIPWYETLNGSLSISGFRMTWLGRTVTHSMVWTLELLRIAPAGSTKVSALLNATALDLVAGGKDQIFTPSYFILGRKK